MSYNPREQKIEKANRIKKNHQENWRKKLAAGRLKAFTWAEDGIRKEDVYTFQYVASKFNHYILVRYTNPASLKHMGKPNMYPKPIDCKVKTAQKDVFVKFKEYKFLSETAGLVVDPTIVGPDAFKDTKKYESALECWNDFLKDKTQAEIKAKIFRRKRSIGCYAVDMDINSKHFGCLMISPSSAIERVMVDQVWDEKDQVAIKNVSDGVTESLPKFYELANSSLESSQAWKFNSLKAEMSCMHGDYDLYALLDAADINARTVTEFINGTKNYCSKHFQKIQNALNREFGCPMIQHGGEFRREHKTDKIYVFYPTEDYRFNAYVIDESAMDIKEIFSLVFGVSDEFG
ncbi:MAG: hypothetical protein GQ583_11485 [Methyloprofundus sp.]|nr:hypothetical protein [Methyloprofundus sp.]